MTHGAWASWIGRERVLVDVIVPTRVAAWQAVFDHDSHVPSNGSPIPVGMHWTLCAPILRQSALGVDGAPRDDGLMPPTPQQRRMWAGCRTTFHRPLLVGDRVERRSRVMRIEEKPGRVGPLVCVTVQHQLSGSHGLAIDEEQEFVFAAPPERTLHQSPPQRGADEMPPPDWRRTVRPDPSLLFRYSTLSGNAHHIHYDRPYATAVEGYAGLVVQGPLLASLMLDLLREHRADAVVERFRVRVRRPTLDTAPFEVCGASTSDARHLRLWSTNHLGERAADGEAWVRATYR